MLHTDSKFSIFFGNIKTTIPRDLCFAENSQEELEKKHALNDFRKTLAIDALLLLKQKHSINGFCVSENNVSSLLTQKEEGDYLVSDVPHIGLGVYTADCLPIIFYDTVTHSIGICHAGWKGSINGIAIQTVKTMEQQFNTNKGNLHIFLGPSAKGCCYKVDDLFVKNIESFAFHDKCIRKNKKELFFDLPRFNQLLLESYGIDPKSFRTQYNSCTICDTSFCSCRRQGPDSKERQLTVVALHDISC